MSGLILRNVSKSYGDNAVLKSMDHTFFPGSVTCVMGPSGRGKTTLLRIIAGLEQPDSGTVSGRPEKIAFVFQENRLSEDFNAVSNIFAVAGRDVSRADIERELANVGIDDLKSPVRTFSGGMKRRVAIVRAMLAEAEMILLDEPFTGLDPKLRLEMIDYVRKKTAGKTVVFVTHDLAEAERFGGDVLELE